MPFITHDEEQERRADPRRRLIPWAAALGAFLLGMALTLWLAREEHRRAEIEHRRAFVESASGVVEAIEQQLSDCERLIRTFQSVFLASMRVTEDDFRLVFENLRDDRARVNLQALAYAERQVLDGRERYITTIFMPVRGNEAIRGLDVGEQPSNLRSLIESRDTNQVSMSAPFKLRQSQGVNTAVDGFILSLPLFADGAAPTTVADRRRTFVGSMGASFRTPNLITSVIPADGGLVAEVAVDDVTDRLPRRLHHHRVGPAASNEQHAQKIRFGGRTWLITVLGARGAAMSPWLGRDLWLGVLMSALLAALSWSLVSTRERALLLARSMSERYRASEERFRRLTELLPSLVL
ncbi:MAG TPA: CHASE domain-containing protein, partial [Steroidobacteraceae bacterium]|nr:CHASE domain-containing protein [Steroidobacteraceae bacterium]